MLTLILGTCGPDPFLGQFEPVSGQADLNVCFILSILVGILRGFDILGVLGNNDSVILTQK